MIQQIHKSFFVLPRTIIKADAVRATDALDTNWAINPFYISMPMHPQGSELLMQATCLSPLPHKARWFDPAVCPPMWVGPTKREAMHQTE